MTPKNKAPQVSKRPKGDKIPNRAPQRPSNSENQFIRFRFDLVDLDSKWCLTRINSAHHKLLLNKLKHFESMKVNEVFNGASGKDYPPSEIIPEAQNRLSEKSLDDIDFISRLSLGGTERLYGQRRGNEFSIIWWDPKHEICPSPLRHT